MLNMEKRSGRIEPFAVFGIPIWNFIGESFYLSITVADHPIEPDKRITFYCLLEYALPLFMECKIPPLGVIG